jgi:hypothetical protein
MDAAPRGGRAKDSRVGRQRSARSQVALWGIDEGRTVMVQVRRSNDTDGPQPDVRECTQNTIHRISLDRDNNRVAARDRTI